MGAGGGGVEGGHRQALGLGFLKPGRGGGARPSAASHTAPEQLVFDLFYVVIGIAGFRF